MTSYAKVLLVVAVTALPLHLMRGRWHLIILIPIILKNTRSMSTGTVSAFIVFSEAACQLL